MKSQLLLSALLATMILNTTATVHADEKEAEALIARVDNLPPIEDLTENHAEEVKSLMEAYADLQMADRVSITNYDTLKESFDALVQKGILTNEDNTLLQEQELQRKKQSQRDISDVAVSQAKEYTFQGNDDKGISIIVRYTTDGDGDGQGEMPKRIVLTSPDGKNYPVSNTSVSMSDEDKLKVDLTWTDLYLQLDFSLLSKGKWTIETSQAVTFSSKSFSGVAADVISEDDKKTVPVEEKKPKKKGSFLSKLLFFGIIGGFIFGIYKFITFMKSPEAPTIDEDALPEGGSPQRLSDQEQLELLKEEYKRQRMDTGEFENMDQVKEGRVISDDIYFKDQPKLAPVRKIPVYDDDDPEDFEANKKEDNDDNDFEMTSDDDTGLLTKEDKPKQQSHIDQSFNDFE